MQASTSASLTSSILSRGLSMNSPTADAWAVATISMSGATGIVREISRAPVATRLIRADSRLAISRFRCLRIRGPPRRIAGVRIPRRAVLRGRPSGRHTSRCEHKGSVWSWGGSLRDRQEELHGSDQDIGDPPRADEKGRCGKFREEQRPWKEGRLRVLEGGG